MSAVCRLVLGLGCLTLGSFGQDAPLLSTMRSLDEELFAAYNSCDLEKFKSMFTADVEFYHDQTGLMTGIDKVAEAVKNNICGKVRRELVPGSLQAFPMKGYGALVTGSHRFHHPKSGRDGAAGDAKFIHLWQNKDGSWKITRVISYDHVSLQK